MERSTPSSCQIPLALAIALFVVAAVLCFAGALAVGIGVYYLTETPGTRHFAVTTPSPEPQATPVPLASATPLTSISPFKSTTPFKPANAAPTPSVELDEYGFRTTQIQIGDETLDVELAVTSEQQTKGLRFRQTLAEDEGMLFIFPSPQRLSFWMKDASIPLSIAYIQPDGKIVQIRSMKPYDETPVPSLSNSVTHALLVNQGWFERHGISAGTVIKDLPR
jgi:uncharacterized membrane protein (UPF0127 family)